MKSFKNLISQFFSRKSFIQWEDLNQHLGSFFKDVELQKDFCKDGYVILRQKANEITHFLENEIHDLSFSNAPFHYSTMIKSPEENVLIHQRIAPIIKKNLANDLFKNYKLYSSTFLIKPALNQSEMDLHQDWSFTDERIFSAATIWIPLQDVDIKNGCVFLLPGTHRIRTNFRSHSLPTSRIKRDAHLDKYIKSATLKKGDVLIFNPTTFHGSYSNKTEEDRLAFAITIMPELAPLIYADNINNQKIRLHYLKDSDIILQINNIVKGGIVESTRSEEIDYISPQISQNEIMSFCRKT